MKDKSIIIGAAAIVAILATAGIAFSSYAFDGGTPSADRPMMGNFQNMSDEEREAMKTEMEAKRQEMEAKQTAVNAALEAGDYQAWLTAVGENCPMLDKINADNFPKLVEAHKLRAQADQIMEELGIAKPDFKGRGFGHKGMMK